MEAARRKQEEGMSRRAVLTQMPFREGLKSPIPT